MKKKSISQALLFVLIFVTTPDDFYKEITTSFTRNSFFIATKVESGGKKMDIVVENDDLYRLMQKANASKTKVAYSAEMFKSLKANSTIAVDANTFQSLEANKLEAESVKKFEVMSKESILKTYFSNSLLKKKLSPGDMNALIMRLYQFKILSKIDEELGYLLIKK
jgi:hypothetical protein